MAYFERAKGKSGASRGKQSKAFFQRASNPGSSLLANPSVMPLQPQVTLPVVGKAPISRGDFNLIMTHKFGVKTIKTGTKKEQEKALTRHKLPPATLPGWQAWDPGSSSMIYNYMVKAFETFGQSFGATPKVSKITFFKTAYNRDPNTGIITPDGTAGASFGLTDLNIFEALTTLNHAIPFARSITGKYAHAPGIVVTSPGSTPGAPMAVPSRSESVIRMIAHELGHGVQSAAMSLPDPKSAPDTGMMDDYMSTIGWTKSPQKLFDIGVPAVVQAISTGSTPPSQHEIKDSNWNHPKWVEQPMSRYSVTGGPGEDFAEAVMVYVTNPSLLKSRSPRRYGFIHNRRGAWYRNMRLYLKAFFSPPGDYPIRTLPEGSAYA